jgi:hypothetical protein
MLITKEATERDAPRSRTSFTIGETVQVVSLGRTGTITGMESGKWLVQLTEGDTPIPCVANNLRRRKTLLG